LAKGCAFFVLKVVAYLTVSFLCYLFSLWNWTYEPVGFNCRGDFIGKNISGVKVLVYSTSRSGTTEMSRTLGKFYTNSWKGEDFLSNMWAPFADTYWQDPEKGGGMFPWQSLSAIGAPAYQVSDFVSRGSKGWLADQEVIKGWSEIHEWLAGGLAMCNVKTLTFDYIDNIFWHVYEVSSDAKVVMLNWRSYQEWRQSRANFKQETRLERFVDIISHLGMHTLPYNAGVLPFYDGYTGNKMLDGMNRGVAMRDYTSPQLNLLKHSFYERRVLQHYNSGMGRDFTEKEYNDFWAEGKKRIPKERLLEFDMTKNTVGDLCKFLGISGDPRCDAGKLPKRHLGMWPTEKENPEIFLMNLPYLLLCHVVSYKVVMKAFGLLASVAKLGQGKQKVS